MTPLPFDYSRCHPAKADTWCKQCRRWANHPNQTWGDRTPAYQCAGSDSESCAYIPIHREKIK